MESKACPVIDASGCLSSLLLRIARSPSLYLEGSGCTCHGLWENKAELPIPGSLFFFSYCTFLISCDNMPQLMIAEIPTFDTTCITLRPDGLAIKEINSAITQ